MEAFLAAVAAKVVTTLVGLLVGLVGGWFGKIMHLNMAKDETKKAIDNAENNNDTSGMFNPK